MADRNRVEVDEKRLMQIMAGDVPLYRAQAGEESEPEPADEEPVQDLIREPAKNSKKKNVRQFDFEGTFLKEAKIKDRRQMYISGEFYDKISGYLRIISEGKISMVGYIHHILAYHMAEFKDVINEMYKNKLNRDEPL